MKILDTKSAELAAQKQTVTTNVTAPGIEMDPGSDASAPTGERHVPFGSVAEGLVPGQHNKSAGMVGVREQSLEFLLSPDDQGKLETQIVRIKDGLKDTKEGLIKTAEGIWFISSYKRGIYWRSKKYESLADCVKREFGIDQSQAYRLAKTGWFVTELRNSPRGQSGQVRLPVNEIQVRALREIPESHWCDFWIQMTAQRDPALMTRGDIEEEARVYLKRNGLNSKVKPNSQTTKVGRVLRKFKDLKEDLSKLKDLDLLDPRIQNLIALLGQKSEGAVDPDEPSDEDLDAIIREQNERDANRAQGGPQLGWSDYLPGAKDDAESDKPEEATV